MAWEVRLTETALRSLREIRKSRGAKAIRQVQGLIERLSEQPRERGKPLKGALKGLYSIRSGRFRVIYTIEDERLSVYEAAAGWRVNGDKKDVYAVVRRMVESGEIGARGRE